MTFKEWEAEQDPTQPKDEEAAWNAATAEAEKRAEEHDDEVIGHALADATTEIGKTGKLTVGGVVIDFLSYSPWMIEHDAQVIDKRDDEWLAALLGNEHGGCWDLAKLEESAKLYRERIAAEARRDALQEGFNALTWDSSKIMNESWRAGYDAAMADAKTILYNLIHNHLAALPASGQAEARETKL